LQKGIRDYNIFQKYIDKNGKGTLKKAMKKVFYWEEHNVFHPDAKKDAEDLYSLRYEDYEQIITDILNDLEEAEEI
jgi:hypothetical protein